MHNRFQISNKGICRDKGEHRLISLTKESYKCKRKLSLWQSLPLSQHQQQLWPMQQFTAYLTVASAVLLPMAKHQTPWVSGTLNSNRFGIKASEDLGDGLKANVVLEGDIITGTGQNAAVTDPANNSACFHVSRL